MWRLADIKSLCLPSIPQLQQQSSVRNATVHCTAVNQLNQPAKVTKKKGGALAESCSGGFKTLSVPVSSGRVAVTQLRLVIVVALVFNVF